MNPTTPDDLPVTESAGQTFRKKPVEIQAVRLGWDTWSEVCAFCGMPSDDLNVPWGVYLSETSGEPVDNVTNLLGLQIPTLEGVMLAREGDWIIRGVQGELYPCKSDIFAATYDLVS